MKETNALNQVAEFHNQFGAPVLPTPKITSRAALRISLIQEELDELREAVDNDNIIGVADALADLQYVLSGAVLEFGLGSMFKDLFDEVHRSNMSKACANLKEAADTKEKYAKEGVETYFKEVDGTYLVYRAYDHKILKSINYSPANLAQIVEQ